MKIFVVGGTGVLGSNTAIHLKNVGYEVTIQGRDPIKCNKMEELGFLVVREDIKDSINNPKSEIRNVCVNSDIIINCAGSVQPYGTAEDFKTANIDCVQVLINECLKSQNKSITLVHISSASVYADLNSHLNLVEDGSLPKKPASEYAASKQQAEILIDNAKKEGLRAITIRPQLVYGAPADNRAPADEHIFGRVVEMNKTGHLPIFDEGNALVDLTHIDNFLQFMELCVKKSEDMIGETINRVNPDLCG